MSWRRMDLSWPVLGILGVLFILSVNLPREWENVARNEVIAETLLAARAPAEPPQEKVEVAEAPKSQPETTPTEPANLPSLAPAVPAATLAPVVAEAPKAEPVAAPAVEQVAPKTPAPEQTAQTSQPTVLPTPTENVVPLPAPGEAEISDQGNPAPLVASNTPSPAPVSPLLEPKIQADNHQDITYPDTGLPAAKAALPEPEPKQTVQAEIPKKPDAPANHDAVAIQWAAPESLLAELDKLASHEATRSWATKNRELIQQLGRSISTGKSDSLSLVEQLRGQVAAAAPLARSIRSRDTAQALLHTNYALERRLAIWQQIAQLDHTSLASLQTTPIDEKALAACLKEIESVTGNSTEGQAWRKYLLMDSLREWAARRKTGKDRMPNELSQTLLRRLNRPAMDASQREFLNSSPLAKLRSEVLRHAVEPIDPARLLTHLEQYERTRLPADAKVLAQDCLSLNVTPNETSQQLSRGVEEHYRNANVRLAISADLMNRLIPKRDPEYAPVNDTVLNLPVHGQSVMASDLAVRLLPDPTRVCLALEVTGEIASLTSSTAGPATFVNEGEAMYVARKPVELSLQGIRLWQTEVEVYNRTQLRGLKTPFDPIPLVNMVVRGVAKSQQQQSLPAAEAEVRQKIAAKAQQRIHEETTAQVTEAARKLNQKVLGPINALLLDPTMIGAETTEERFIMRVRLAGKDQLGSHTARPQAPIDSLASIQIHETALNNVIQRLELDGQTFTVPDLGKHIAKRLQRPDPKKFDPDQEDVKITFAKEDAVRVRCVDGRLEITLSVAKLSKSPRRWKDIQVRAYYKPRIEGCSVVLVRDDVVQLIGPPQSTSAQIALRGIFSKVFSQKTPWNVTPERFQNNPKLADLAITQFTIQDGWIGAAIGPQRTALRETSLLR